MTLDPLYHLAALASDQPHESLKAHRILQLKADIHALECSSTCLSTKRQRALNQKKTELSKLSKDNPSSGHEPALNSLHNERQTPPVPPPSQSVLWAKGQQLYQDIQRSDITAQMDYMRRTIKNYGRCHPISRAAETYHQALCHYDWVMMQPIDPTSPEPLPSLPPPMESLIAGQLNINQAD